MTHGGALRRPFVPVFLSILSIVCCLFAGRPATAQNRVDVAGGKGLVDAVRQAKPGDVIIWRAMSIDPSQTVSLDEFIDKDGFNIFCGNGPSKIGEVWTGVVDNYPPGTEESYTFVFSINGSGKYDWDPKIQIQPDSD